MSYFAVSDRDSTLSYYVWADSRDAAIRRVEEEFGAMPPRQALCAEIPVEDVGDVDVLDEPEEERTTRWNDYVEQEDEV